MLTPNFKIEQTDDELTIVIHAPYSNLQDLEVEHFGKQFLFSASPYFLRLCLPGEIMDSQDQSNGGAGTYDCDKGEFIFKIMKKNKGEYFSDLDMITELLRPSTKVTAEPLVQEEPMDQSGDALMDEECMAEQKVDPIIGVDKHCATFGYGFAWQRHGVIGKLAADIGKFIDLTNPDDIPIANRTALCESFDKRHFNADHYIADLFDGGPLLDECLRFELSEKCFKLSFESRGRLKELPKRTHPNLSDEMHKAIALSLIDLLYAYLYDLRTTDAEHSVETGWTLVKLSPTLSFSIRWENAREALIGTIRRSLCYPLYRNWRLSMKVFEDLKKLLTKGRTAILQCLIDMRTVLSVSGEHRYLFNDLYLTDYCLWIQRIPDSMIEWLSQELATISINRCDVNLELDEVELEAQFQMLNHPTPTSHDELDSDDYE